MSLSTEITCHHAKTLTISKTRFFKRGHDNEEFQVVDVTIHSEDGSKIALVLFNDTSDGGITIDNNNPSE